MKSPYTGKYFKRPRYSPIYENGESTSEQGESFLGRRRILDGSRISRQVGMSPQMLTVLDWDDNKGVTRPY